MKKIILLLMFCSAAVTLYAQDYTLFQGEKGKFGLKDKSGKIIVPAKYSYISPRFSEEYTWGRIGDKTGFVNKAGKEITLFKYDDANHFKNGFAPVNIGAELDEEIDEIFGGKWGFINTAGKEITPIKYDDYDPFINGFAPVNIGAKLDEETDEMVGGKWGFINTSGKEITPIKYDNTSNFGDKGFAVVVIGEKYGIINSTGKEIAPLKYDYIKFLSSETELALVNIGGKYDDLWGKMAFSQFAGGKQGFINCITGKEIAPIQFDNVADFAEGLASVNIGAVYDGVGYPGGKWGYIDKTGKMVIPVKYEDAGYFHEGRAEVKLNGQTFFIDKTGKQVK